MKVGLLIDNLDVDAQDGATFERKNPVTGECVTEASAASAADSDRCVASAQKAFASWSKTTPNERRNILFRAGQLLMERSAELVNMMVAETGTAKSWAIEANGKSYSPPKKVNLSPYVFGERQRIFSENRIKYSMKRVDSDPSQIAIVPYFFDDGQLNPML